MEPNVTLYPYQQDAVDAMYKAESFLLADEMGLGKTVSTLMEVRQRLDVVEDMSVLVVCPKSVIPVWYDHAKWLIPEVKDFVVTNYEQVRVNPKAYLPYYWTYVICDEAHFIKSRNALRTKAVKRLKAHYKRALTGTPVVNRPDELWSVLNWLWPHDYKSYWRFFETFCEYFQHPTIGYKKVTGVKNVEALHALLEGKMLRRLKKNVLLELPDKYYTNIPVTLGPAQFRVYEEMRKESLAWVGEHENEPVAAPVVIARLSRLRMFAGAYADITDGRVRLTEPSAKLDALDEILEDAGDSPVVVFSMFRQMIDLASARLTKAGVPHSVLTGKTPQGQRGQMVDDFQTGKCNVFLGTIPAGGVGITLHRASTVVFLDRSWSPADNVQAEDRLHRIGQKNAVQVILLSAVDSVDQQVEAKLELKWSWIRKMLGG